MWIAVATPPMQSLEQFDAITTQVGSPEGLQARYAGRADDGNLRVVSLWESKAHADRFFAEKLGPALAAVMGPEPVGTPQVIGVDVERTYTR